MSTNGDCHINDINDCHPINDINDCHHITSERDEDDSVHQTTTICSRERG
jgi:hypothetical protein